VFTALTVLALSSFDSSPSANRCTYDLLIVSFVLVSAYFLGSSVSEESTISEELVAYDL
jgi:hypothetical protein